nr:hypothetical protein [Tanacetum cinerariifolium]
MSCEDFPGGPFREDIRGESYGQNEFVSVNSDAASESFSPSPILVKDSYSFMLEIDLFCTLDYQMSPGIKDKDYASKRDILIPKDLPSNNSLSFAKKESFHFDIPLFSRPPAKPPDGDTRILNINMMGDIYDQKDFMHKLMITLASHQEKSPDLLSHRCGTVKKFNTHRSHLNECPMLIHRQNNPPLDVLLITMVLLPSGFLEPLYPGIMDMISDQDIEHMILPTPPRDTEPPIGSPISLSPSSSVGSSSPVRSTTPPPDYSFDESIFAELDNSLWIILRPPKSKPVLKEPNKMAPKRTSTSAALAMTQVAIQKLVADNVAAALQAQATTMANTYKTNRNTQKSGTPIERKCSYKEFMMTKIF